MWARNGRELFYRNGNKMMSVEIEDKPSFTFTNPRLLFTGYVSGLAGLPGYDVAPDGQRFLMLKANDAAEAQLNIVVNWLEEPKTLSGAGVKK